MAIVILGIDLGKNVCSLVGLNAEGAVVLRRRLRRCSVVDFVLSLSPCTVAMEACCGAHHLGRVFEEAGLEVRLMSPEYVRPYVKAHKNDDRDAEAIAEAATRPTMRFVPVKSEVQSDIQALHRARSRLIAARTALINHLRALLLERGIVAQKGRKKLETQLEVFADEEDGGLSPRIRLLVEDLRAEWRQLDTRIAAFDGEFARMAKEDGAARRRRPSPSGRTPCRARRCACQAGATRRADPQPGGGCGAISPPDSSSANTSSWFSSFLRPLGATMPRSSSSARR